jgi:hydrophobe/amphiphile efflux-1 (HAE1) family protein
MNISAWSIRNPVAVIVLFLVLTLAGMLSFPTLGIDENPNIDIPNVQILVTQSGADPTELESQVTKKVEDSVASIGNIDTITSTVTDGASTTIVSFVLGTDSDRATNDVRNAVAQIRQDLPESVNEPVVQRLDFAGGPVVIYAVEAPSQSVTALSNLVDQDISRALLAVPGVSQVERIGGVDREINVELNPAALDSLGITATQVNEQLSAFNTNLPGGSTEAGGSQQTIRTLGSAATVEQLAQYEVVLSDGGSVPLSSLGSVSDGTAEPTQLARFNGEPVVAFSVIRSTGTTLVSVEEGVKEAVETLGTTLPEGVKLNLIVDNADAIRESYAASIEALVLGALLAVVVIWLFLRNWRATFITAVALPLSLVPTFAVLKILGYTLNSMTLLALALVVGILVDDAIVEIENIERHMDMGKSPLQASLDASAEIGLAVVATTFSIVAVFGPVALMSGISGQFFRPFGVTVAASVLFSLLVARMVTPLMAVHLLRPHSSPHLLPHSLSNHASSNHALTSPTPLEIQAQIEQDALKKDRLSFRYRQLLIWALKHRVVALMGAIAFLIGSLFLVPHIPVGLFTQADVGLITLNLTLPPGATLADTDAAVQLATQKVRTNPAVASVQTDERVGSATLFVGLKEKGDRVRQSEVQEQLRPLLAQVPGVRLSVNSGGPGGGSKELEITLGSENPEALTQAADALEAQMQQVPGLIEVNSSASLRKPEILIKPDPQSAADQGVTVQSIAQTALIATIGSSEASQAKFNLSDRQIPVQVQLAPKYRNDLDVIRNLKIPSSRQTLVPLQTVASVSQGSGPSEINRYNRSRNVTVGANLQGAALGDALAAVNALPALQNLPPEVKQQDSGNAKILNEIFANFGLAILTALVFIYAVLALLFNNFLHPLTIMTAMPFSIGGALLGLLIAQKELGLFALIGIVLLLGLVAKNAILLVDYALIHRHEGKPTYRAVVESGVARLRPILMTTIAMVAGMAPIALSIGAGSAERSPMAIAVVGGLITSTLLTLVVVPVIFSYFDSWLSRSAQPRPAKVRQWKLKFPKLPVG